MAMTVIWTGMTAAAVLCALLTGQEAQVGAAALEGARAAVTLCLSIAGPMCLWTGVLEVMEQSGLAEGLARLLRPVLLRLYPGLRGEQKTMAALSANVSANLLGLGSAATPMGLRAVKGMAKKSPGRASDEMCLLIVCNSASIQLLPTTVAAVRAAEGSAAPFDILPAVWLTSALALGAGILACKLLAAWWRD